MTKEFNPQQLILPAIVLILFVVFAIIMIYRKKEHKGWIFEILAGLISAGIGVFGGMGAQILYTSGGEIPLFGNGVDNPEWVGGIAGGILGFLAGVWFVKYIRELLAGGYGANWIIGKGTEVGIVPGIICSTMVHVVLMTAYRNGTFWPMLIGAGFGVGSGPCAGLLISGVFVLFHQTGIIKLKEQQ